MSGIGIARRALFRLSTITALDAVMVSRQGQKFVKFAESGEKRRKYLRQPRLRLRFLFPGLKSDHLADVHS